MGKQGTIGLATVLALAAAVGFSLQTGLRSNSNGGGDSSSAVTRSKPAIKAGGAYDFMPGCGSLQEEIGEFLEVDNLRPPDNCLKTGNMPPKKDLTQDTSCLKFVIALLPDPVHTHMAVMFDQYTVAIQEGAQDENYDFDNSWLPWEDKDSPYTSFADEKLSNSETEDKENQPGLILFRKSLKSKAKGSPDESSCKADSGPLSRSYRDGIVVFVVGEDATHGIHREQFRNALLWIDALRPHPGRNIGNVAILGPSFSGSLPSLNQLLLEPEVINALDLTRRENPRQLAIYSGSVSSKDSAETFQKEIKNGIGDNNVIFHSFVNDDDTTFNEFCGYLKKIQPDVHPSELAVLSEDQTAYGREAPQDGTTSGKPGGTTPGKQEDAAAGKSKGKPDGKQDGATSAEPGGTTPGKQDNTAAANSEGTTDGQQECTTPGKSGDTAESCICFDKALWLYYPRDISQLRGAYQTNSLFNAGTSSESANNPGRNLPTDLADPSGRVHDTIRTYGGNQTPLAQEATLLDMAAALRELRTRYILVRGSNALDQLFLTDFLRRSYPDGRIVILGSDLMFIRERGSTGLGGAMTLTTYPLYPPERKWTGHQASFAPDRVFSSDYSEATYIAFRLLLKETRLHYEKSDDLRCRVVDDPTDESKDNTFVPPVVCGAKVNKPIPDYSPPFWTLSNQCGEFKNPDPQNPLKVQNTGDGCPFPGPTAWLSVIGGNTFWPIASLNIEKINAKWPGPTLGAEDRSVERKLDAGARPEMPLGMKVFWLILIGFSIFHFCCCLFGSYTAKPAFRAHFASTKDLRHLFLIFCGSCIVAFLAIVTASGCGVFSKPIPGLGYPWPALCCGVLVFLLAWAAILANICAARELSESVPPNLPRMTPDDARIWKYCASAAYFVATLLFSLVFVIPLESALQIGSRIFVYWRSMHLVSGVSPIIPILSFLVGLYIAFWYTLHGLALFGPDRPRLPPKYLLLIRVGPGDCRHFLRMFSQEDAAERIELLAKPLQRGWSSLAWAAAMAVPAVVLYGLAYYIARGVPIRSLGGEGYAIIFLAGLAVCGSLCIFEAWRFYTTWERLRKLLVFLDRLPLRRTLQALQGFSWGNVWKISGNVLEVRYKLISRQLEAMNHTIETLRKARLVSFVDNAETCLDALRKMRTASMNFAQWYSDNYLEPLAGDLNTFCNFQESVAWASGTLLTKLLAPAWREEEESLIGAPLKPSGSGKDDDAQIEMPRARDPHICNAEELVCLTYMGFVQNILGRLRTMAMTVMALFLAMTVAISSYPFDPRQALSAVLIALFVIVGGFMIKAYAEMHRDSTLSHVTDTKPGELGTEFWLKLVGFGLAPALGLIARIFPGITDFIFTWLQPGISSLK